MINGMGIPEILRTVVNNFGHDAVARPATVPVVTAQAMIQACIDIAASSAARASAEINVGQNELHVTNAVKEMARNCNESTSVFDYILVDASNEVIQGGSPTAVRQLLCVHTRARKAVVFVVDGERSRQGSHRAHRQFFALRDSDQQLETIAKEVAIGQSLLWSASGEEEKADCSDAPAHPPVVVIVGRDILGEGDFKLLALQRHIMMLHCTPHQTAMSKEQSDPPSVLAVSDDSDIFCGLLCGPVTPVSHSASKCWIATMLRDPQQQGMGPQSRTGQQPMMGKPPVFGTKKQRHQAYLNQRQKHQIDRLQQESKELLLSEIEWALLDTSKVSNQLAAQSAGAMRDGVVPSITAVDRLSASLDFVLLFALTMGGTCVPAVMRGSTRVDAANIWKCYCSALRFMRKKQSSQTDVTRSAIKTAAVDNKIHQPISERNTKINVGGEGLFSAGKKTTFSDSESESDNDNTDKSSSELKLAAPVTERKKSNSTATANTTPASSGENVISPVCIEAFQPNRGALLVPSEIIIKQSENRSQVAKKSADGSESDDDGETAVGAQMMMSLSCEMLATVLRGERNYKDSSGELRHSTGGMNASAAVDIARPPTAAERVRARRYLRCLVQSITVLYLCASPCTDTRAGLEKSAAVATRLQQSVPVAAMMDNTTAFNKKQSDASSAQQQHQSVTTAANTAFLEFVSASEAPTLAAVLAVLEEKPRRHYKIDIPPLFWAGTAVNNSSCGNRDFNVANTNVSVFYHDGDRRSDVNGLPSRTLRHELPFGPVIPMSRAAQVPASKKRLRSDTNMCENPIIRGQTHMPQIVETAIPTSQLVNRRGLDQPHSIFVPSTVTTTWMQWVDYHEHVAKNKREKPGSNTGGNQEIQKMPTSGTSMRSTYSFARRRMVNVLVSSKVARIGHQSEPPPDASANETSQPAESQTPVLQNVSVQSTRADASVLKANAYHASIDSGPINQTENKGGSSLRSLLGNYSSSDSSAFSYYSL